MQVAVDHGHAGGQPHPVLRAPPAGRRALGGGVGLAEHDVGGRPGSVGQGHTWIVSYIFETYQAVGARDW